MEVATAVTGCIVMKFGGAALADAAGVRRACRLVAAAAAERPLVVVSAVAGVTDQLEQVARAAARGTLDPAPVRLRHRSLIAGLGLDPEPCDRLFSELALVLEAVRRTGELDSASRDFVLALGERLSARIVAGALRAAGVRATALDACDLGLVADATRTRLVAGSAERVRAALATVAGVPVVTGFVAADEAGRVTTLGRNGSDLSASLLAEALAAREAQFWKDVAGVLTADPRRVPGARPVRRMSWSQARALGAAGARVLHSEALAPLERARIPARVLCVLEPGAGGTGGGTEIGPLAAVGPVALACRLDARGGRLVLVGAPPPGLPALDHVLHSAGIAAEPGEHALEAVVAAAELDLAARTLHQRLFTSAAQLSGAVQ
jgi:aspartate kinase